MNKRVGGSNDFSDFHDDRSGPESLALPAKHKWMCSSANALGAEKLNPLLTSNVHCQGSSTRAFISGRETGHDWSQNVETKDISERIADEHASGTAADRRRIHTRGVLHSIRNWAHEPPTSK